MCLPPVKSAAPWPSHPQKVAFTRSIRPLVSATSRPHAACSYKVSADGSGWSAERIALHAQLSEKRVDCRATGAGRAEVRTMADVLDHMQRTERHGPLHVFADRAWRDDVLAALQDQRGR